MAKKDYIDVEVFGEDDETGEFSYHCPVCKSTTSNCIHFVESCGEFVTLNPKKKPKTYPKPKEDTFINELQLQSIKQLGKWDKNYGYWRQTETEQKRKDIDPKRYYLVINRCSTIASGKIYYIGQFMMQLHGWRFHPNGGSFSIQIEHIEEFYLLLDIPPDKD